MFGYPVQLPVVAIIGIDKTVDADFTFTMGDFGVLFFVANPYQFARRAQLIVRHESQFYFAVRNVAVLAFPDSVGVIVGHAPRCGSA